VGERERRLEPLQLAAELRPRHTLHGVARARQGGRGAGQIAAFEARERDLEPAGERDVEREAVLVGQRDHLGGAGLAIVELAGAVGQRDVDEHSRIAGSQRAWAMGPLTKGRYWEIIAVPDIRGQAAAVAEDIAMELKR